MSLKSHQLTQNSYDKTCLSKTFFEFSCQDDDDKLAIDGYSLTKLVEVDPSESKKDAFCIYFAEHKLLFKKDDILDNGLVN